MKDTQFHQLLDRFGFSWAGYRRVRKGVKKRLARHMQERPDLLPQMAKLRQPLREVYADVTKISQPVVD